MRIILADDHPVVLIGVRQVLREHARVDVVGEASSADELFALLAHQPCDVLVTDYAMPGSRRPDGEMMLRHIRERWPELAVVLLTSGSNVAFLRRASDLGIAAIIEKVAGIAELPAAINAAFARRTYTSNMLKGRLARVSNAKHRSSGMSALSPAEFQVARMYSTGMKVTDIAADLHRAVATISRQKNNAMRKLGVSNHVELLDVIRGSADGDP